MAEAATSRRVISFALRANETGDALIRSLKTDDVMRIRGIVQFAYPQTFMVSVEEVAEIAERTGVKSH